MDLVLLADLMGRRVEELRCLPPEDLPPPVVKPVRAPLRIRSEGTTFVFQEPTEWDFETVCKWSASPEFRKAWAEWCRAEAKRSPRGRV